MKWLHINFLRYGLIGKSMAMALLCLLWISGMSMVWASSLLPDQEVEPVESLVKVGKYRLNFKVITGNDLAILLEAGGGMDSGEWNKIAPELAHKTGATIVSYDRAGFGKSDLPETPHDMREEVEWLWQGLQKLELQKDLILVGHSFGGWMIRLFASEHPEAVRGMVFVDPFTNEFVDMLGIEYLDNHPMAGKIPFDTSQPDILSKYQRALVRMVGDGLGPKMEIMSKTKLPSDIPVVVITSGMLFLPKTEEQEAWRLSHEQLTASIEGATLIVAEESGHMVPAIQPDLIIEAVLDVIKRNSPLLKGPYLGQLPPGKKAELFAPEVIRYEVHGSPSISTNEKEIIIASMSEGMKYYKMVEGVWQEQTVLPFDIPDNCNGMFISPSDKRKYFLIWEEDDENFYVSEKNRDKWTKPRSLGEEVNSFKTHWQFTTAKNENLYFSSEGKIMVSVFNGEIHLKPAPLKLSSGKNLEGGTPYIAPDESYIMYSMGSKNYDDSTDLYISYKMSSGKWTSPKNLGVNINSPGSYDLCPKVSPNGKFLFFISRRNGPDFQLYWADAKIIEELKPDYPK